MRCRNSGFRGICATVRRPATGWRWSLQLMLLVSSVCVCRSLSNRWENLLLAPERKVAICAIEKNGWTIMSPLMSLMNSVNLTHRLPSLIQCVRITTGIARPPSDKSGETSRVSKESLTIRSGGRLWCCESRWSGTFLATTQSATIPLPPIEAGRRRANISSASRLQMFAPQQCRPPTDGAAQIWARGIKDPHWAPQHTFCGGLTNKSLRRYTSVIPYRNIRWGLAAVLAGRLPLDHDVRTQLGEMLGVDWVDNGTAFTSKNRPPPPPSIGRTHMFHSESKMVCQLSRESRARLAKAYTGQTTSCRGCKPCRGILRSAVACRE